jgi:hypothetical protein
VPEGWTRVRPGRPLLEHQEKDKLRLQWCPLCGPGTEFRIDTDGGKVWGSAEVDEHIAEHRPAQFGLSPLRTGDRSLDEFGEVA